MINLDSILTNSNVSNSIYFFINLLLKDNINMVNYEYSFDSIKIFNNIINNNQNNIFIDISGSKLIIDLIDNYKQLDKYDEEKEEEELKIIENESLNKIKNSLNELKKFDLILDEDTVKESKIDKIYIDIIKMLIKKNKIDSNEILDKLDLKNINITKAMLDELSNILDNNINNYKISNQEDLIDNKKINFYFILFEYILKNQIYIYHIPFLLKTKKQIIKIIKSHEFSINNLKDDSKQRLIDIINFITDSEYYYNKYLKSNDKNFKDKKNSSESIGNMPTKQNINQNQNQFK